MNFSEKVIFAKHCYNLSKNNQKTTFWQKQILYENIFCTASIIRSKNRSTLKFVADAKLHLVFDLTGNHDTAPFILDTVASFVNFNLVEGDYLIVLDFPIWRFYEVPDKLDNETKKLDVNFDQDWVFYLYYNFLDAINEGKSAFSTISEIQKLEFLIKQSLNFFPNFQEVFDNTSEQTFSSRHTRRLFRKYLKYSPKQIEQVSKFQKNLISIIETQKITWQEYYDQSHFIKNFKKFSGNTPIEFLKLYL
jgi:hypothetical protein